MRLKPIQLKQNRSLDIVAAGQEVNVYYSKNGGLHVTVYTMGNIGAIEPSEGNDKGYNRVTAMDDTKYTDVTLVTSCKNK